MELFHLDNLLGLRGVLLVLWLFLFVLSIFVIISGMKAEDKIAKAVILLLGLLLAGFAVYLFIYTFFFGFNS